MKRYLVNEVFSSIQGEGVRAGTAATFVRFAKCNLSCNVADHGFDCDTDFERGDWWDHDHLVADVSSRPARWVILTGGEPALQINRELVDSLHDHDLRVAIETNGTRGLPDNLDWVCVSPKPGTALAVRWADEAKYVLAAGQEPDGRVDATTRLVSPAFKGDDVDPAAVAWCVGWVLTHPEWRLSCQQHKWWGVR